MERHYLKIADGKTQLIETQSRWTESPVVIAEWNRELTAEECGAIQRDEYMTFMLR